MWCEWPLLLTAPPFSREARPEPRVGMEKSEKKPMRFSFRRRPKSVSVDRSEAHAADVSIGQYLEKLNYVR